MEKYHKVSPKIAQTFEIIGSYFCDIYYNHLYLSAKSKKKNTDASNTKPHLSQSITDEYKQAVVAFGYAIKKDKNHYLKAITGMYRFYQTYSKYTTMTLNQFIDMLLGIFIPEDYINQLDSKQRDQLLVKIVISLIDNLCIFVTRPDILPLIIDNHGDSTNINMLQDHAVETLINERDKMFSLFVSANVSPEQEIVTKLKSSLKDILKSKITLENENKTLKQRVSLLETKIKELAKELMNAKQSVPAEKAHDPFAYRSSVQSPIHKSISLAPVKNQKKDIVDKKDEPTSRKSVSKKDESAKKRPDNIKRSPDDRARQSPDDRARQSPSDRTRQSSDDHAKALGLRFKNESEDESEDEDDEDDSDNDSSSVGSQNASDDDVSAGNTLGSDRDASEASEAPDASDDEVIDEAERLLRRRALSRLSKRKL